MDDYDGKVVKAVQRECRRTDCCGLASGHLPVTAGLVEVLLSLLETDDRAPDGECHVCGAGTGELHSGNCPFAAAERVRALLDEEGIPW